MSAHTDRATVRTWLCASVKMTHLVCHMRTLYFGGLLTTQGYCWLPANRLAGMTIQIVFGEAEERTAESQSSCNSHQKFKAAVFKPFWTRPVLLCNHHCCAECWQAWKHKLRLKGCRSGLGLGFRSVLSCADVLIESESHCYSCDSCKCPDQDFPAPLYKLLSLFRTVSNLC